MSYQHFLAVDHYKTSIQVEEDHWEHSVVEMLVEGDAEVLAGSKMVECHRIEIALVDYVEGEDEGKADLVEVSCYQCNRNEGDISVDYIVPCYPSEEEEEEAGDDEVDWIGNN